MIIKHLIRYSIFDWRPKYNITEIVRNKYERMMFLTIHDWQRSDESQFSCISTNSLGKADGRIQSYSKYKSEISWKILFKELLFQMVKKLPLWERVLKKKLFDKSYWPQLEVEPVDPPFPDACMFGYNSYSRRLLASFCPSIRSSEAL